MKGRLMSYRLRLLGVSAVLAAGLPFGSTSLHAHAASRVHAAKVPQRCAKHITPKGTVKFSDWEFPDTLNVNQSSLSVTTYVINAMFDGLFLFDQKARLIPQMATAV